MSVGVGAMWARIVKSIYLTKGEKAFVQAYGVIIAMTTGMTMLVMSGVDGPNAIPAEPSFYAFWTIFSGALSGGVALFAARGWMGRVGKLGLFRAIVGSGAIALIAAVLAGALIVPLTGAFYAPVLMITEFIEKPWLAAIWFAVSIGAHFLMSVIVEERALGYGRGTTQRATSQLSALSQAQLYRRT